MLLANTPAQAKSLLHSRKQAAGDFGFNMKANKKEYMYFKEIRAISALSCKPQKLVVQFTYLSSNISSTEGMVCY